jgi:hypothetical protein
MASVVAIDEDVTAELTAGKMRDETVKALQESRFASAGRTGHDCEIAVPYGPIDLR